jgi:hypothetical protein
LRLPEPLALVRQRGLVVFEGLTASRDVNLVAIRHGRSTPGSGDDLLYACWRERAGGSWTIKAWRCETEPGAKYLRTPINPKGTAIMAPGQYRRAYARGYHNGRPALRQVEPIKAYRDANRDGVVDISPHSIDQGLFAMNIHDVSLWGELAGCIGLMRPDLEELLAVYDMTAALHGVGISLTLLDAAER